MSDPPVSVVIVSRGRPDDLRVCLTGVSQQIYHPFEVVLVSDADGCSVASQFGSRIKTVRYEEANISAARNAGIAAAAGEIIAFIDDDAVPEPTWLTYLTEPFARLGVNVVGGCVLGRNGITPQWQARQVTRQGWHRGVETDGQDAVILPVQGDWLPKTEGTNMAVKSDTLRAIGGFDPAFRFYLDETDLNVRLTEAGHKTAYAPQAQVHHRSAASTRRKVSRAPRTLFEIGASIAVFLRKHAGSVDVFSVISEQREDQRRRLLRHMVGGTIEPADVQPILKSFDEGVQAGLGRKPAELPLIPPGQMWQPMVHEKSESHHRLFSGRSWQRGSLRDAARRHVAEGGRATVFCFSPTAFFHKVRFHADGVWEHRGGLYGRSDRSQPLVQFPKFGQRVSIEATRVAKTRNMDHNTVSKTR